MKSIIANSEDESVAFSSNNLSVENNLPVSISGIKKVYSVSVEELNQHSSLSRSGKVTIELQKEFISGSYIYLTNSELTQLGMDYNLYSIEETGFLYNGNYYESDLVGKKDMNAAYDWKLKAAHQGYIEVDGELRCPSCNKNENISAVDMFGGPY
jgi:hypothetical protein